MRASNRCWKTAGLAVMTAMFMSPVVAQDRLPNYPTKPVRLLVTVAPGAIDTSMSTALGGDGPPAGGSEDPIREFSESMAMLGRWGRPEEVAKAVAWAASDDASYLTGTTLVLDGGWSRMHMPPHVTQAVVGGPRRA